MLGAAITSSSPGPRLPSVQLSEDWGLCLDWQTQLLLSYMQVHPVGKLGMCPRKTRTEATDTTSYTERVLPSTVPTYRIDIRGKPREPYLLIFLGWQRQEVTHAGTHMIFSCPMSHQLPGSTQCLVQTNRDACQASYHRIIESLKHRIYWRSRDPWESWSSSPSPKQDIHHVPESILEHMTLKGATVLGQESQNGWHWKGPLEVI